MNVPTKIRAKASGDKVEVRLLMTHDMETGQRKSADGQLVPAWFIQKVTAKCNNRVVLQANWGPAVSKNPFLVFSFKGAKIGDTVEITWADSKGNSRTDKATVV